MEKVGTMVENRSFQSNEPASLVNNEDSLGGSSATDSEFGLEQTLMEMEQLIRDDEAIDEVLDAISELEASEMSSKHSQSLDENFNELKTKDVPVITICSDDEDLEVTDEIVKTDQSPTTVTTVSVNNIVSPKAVPAVGNVGIPVATEVDDKNVVPIYCDDSQYRNPYAPSPTFDDQPSSKFVQNMVVEELSAPPPPSISLTSTPVQPKGSSYLSELQNLGVTNVLASFLDYKRDPVAQLKSSHDNSSTGIFRSPIHISAEKTSVSELRVVLSRIDDPKSPSFKNLCKSLEESELDSSNSLSSDAVEINSPSPLTEALLLADNNCVSEQSSEVLPSCGRSKDVKSNKFAEAQEEKKPTGILPSDECRPVKNTDNALLIATALPSPPPPISKLLEDNLCPHESNNFQEEAKTLEAPLCPQEVVEQETQEDLVSEETDPVEEKIATGSSCVAVDVFHFGQESQGSKEFKFEAVPPAHIGTAAADTVSSTAPSSATCEVETAAEPPKDIPSWQIPWISTDEAENADNNDPKWEILKTLETDRDRYEVVREKWRQLRIPDPRKDLTSHNFRRRRSRPNGRSVNYTEAGSVTQSRKRTRSDDGDDANDHPSKRRRMLSCTQMFEDRIDNLRRQLDEDFLQLKDEHHEELQKLSVIQQQELNRCLFSSAPHHIVKQQMQNLHHYQQQQVDSLQYKFDDKLADVSEDKIKTINLLTKASEEVYAFNKFYTDLKCADDDHCNITEEEFCRFHETEQMYDYYDEVYIE